MSGIAKKIEQKLGDHPNVSNDDNINPRSSIGIGANQGDDPNKSWVQNKIEAGQGAGHPQEGPKAGSTSSSDTVSAGQKSGAIDSEYKDQDLKSAR